MAVTGWTRGHAGFCWRQDVARAASHAMWDKRVTEGVRSPDRTLASQEKSRTGPRKHKRGGRWGCGDSHVTVPRLDSPSRAPHRGA